MYIAREGARVILAFIGLHIICLLAAWFAAGGQWGHHFAGVFAVLAFIFALGALFSLYFFRDPERTPPEGDNLAVSPADGRILSVEDVVEDRFIHGPASRVSIFMNVFDVHVNRFPVSGTVLFQEYRPGRFFNASLDKASVHNEALSLGIEMEGSGTRILVRQIAGLIARRIVCRVKEGDPARRGERFGMIRFGSRVEVYFPPPIRIMVNAGEKVIAGQSVLAELP